MFQGAYFGRVGNVTGVCHVILVSGDVTNLKEVDLWTGIGPRGKGRQGQSLAPRTVRYERANDVLSWSLRRIQNSTRLMYWRRRVMVSVRLSPILRPSFIQN